MSRTSCLVLAAIVSVLMFGWIGVTGLPAEEPARPSPPPPSPVTVEVRGRLVGKHDLTIFLSLFDGTAQALGSTALVPAPSLEAWSSARIGVSRTVTTERATRAEQFVAGKITSIRVVH